jgi:leucyl aminopeptidase
MLAVGKGSSRPPRLVRLGYVPNDARGHLALVGKGITFDSGGLNTKSTGGMELMRADMAGAASILAVMELVGRVRPDFAVTAWLAVADNMSGPAAMRPGDVVRARNGVSIEILNTDAEGRLVLADALSMAAEERPDAIVDVATLTDTVSDALGPDVVGVMGNNRDLARRIYLAGKASGEAVWPLPLPRSFAPLNESDVADLRNIQRGPYGFVVAGGCFLERFVDRLPWAHIDVGMAAMRPDPHGGNPPGATGWGVRMLSALIDGFTKPEVSDQAGWDPF